MATIQEVRAREQEQARLWYLKNREKVLARAKSYYESHREEILAKIKGTPTTQAQRANNAEWRRNNQDSVRANRKKWKASEGYKKHVERRKNNPKRATYMKAYLGKYHLENQDKLKADYKRRYQVHKAEYISRSNVRRALQQKATVNLSSIKAWMKSVMSRSKNTCYYCQREIPKGKLHFDHIVALSKGGSHSVENLCVSCASCNLSKHDKPVSAWVRVGQQILSL